jgi:hypothetical protein
MADVSNLRSFVEAYGIAVRAGLITPCLEDENVIREKFGFGPAPASVVADWAKTEGVRKPNTIKSAPAEIEEETDAADGNFDGKNEE